jgi:transcriptional regulator with XRE-family HTH domain
MQNARRRRFLQHFETALGSSREALMRRTGYTKGRISQLFDDEQAFGEKAARNLASRLGLAEDFFEADHETRLPSGPVPPVAHSMSLDDLRLPPVELQWGDLMKTGELPDQFQVRVPDGPLAPLVPAGALVTFDTTISEIRPGDGVLVRDREGALHFRRYRAGAAGRWEAFANSEAYRQLDSERDGLTIIGVYVGAEHRLG